MNERTILRGFTAALALAQIAAAVYLIAIDRSEHVPLLFAAAAFATGAVGTAALPSLLESRSQSSPKPPRKPPTLPLTLLVLALAVVVAGCGGPPEAATRALNGATRGLLELDRLEAPRFAAAHAEALPATSTWAEYDARMRPHLELERYMRFSLREIATLDAAFRAWSSADQSDWMGTVACVALGLERSVSGAEALDLEVPDELGGALELVRQFAGALCPRAAELEDEGDDDPHKGFTLELR